MALTLDAEPTVVVLAELLDQCEELNGVLIIGLMCRFCNFLSDLVQGFVNTVL